MEIAIACGFPGIDLPEAAGKAVRTGLPPLYDCAGETAACGKKGSALRGAAARMFGMEAGGQNALAGRGPVITHVWAGNLGGGAAKSWG